MKVTRITTQKNNDKRLNVFIDDGSGEKFGFSIDMDVFAKYNLRKGLELDEKLMGELLYEDEVKKGFQAALNYLSYRIRSQKEIEDYLRGKEIGEAVITSVIKRLHDYKYIDDKEFAKAFVRTKKRTTLKGPLIIQRELIEKGLSQQHIEEGLDEYSIEEQLAVAAAFVQKKSKQTRKQSNHEAKQKLKQSLMQKGFTFDVIEAVLSQADNIQNEEEEREALAHHAEKALRKYRKYEGRELELKLKQYLYRKGFQMEKINRWLESHSIR